MADTGGLPNTVWALVLLWGFALPAFWHGMDLLMNPERRYWPAILFSISLGLVFAYGGLAATGYVAPELGKPIAKWIQPIASDPRWAILVWFIVLIWATGPRFVQRIRGASANALRLAEEDAAIMEQRIHFYTHVDVLGEPKLTGTGRFIEFHQPIFNASVIPVTFDADIEGRILIDGEEQKDKLEIAPRTPLQELQVRRGGMSDISIRLWLTSEVATQMQERTATIFGFGNTALYFSFKHRGKKVRVRKSIGNQVTWKNKELLANAKPAPESPPAPRPEKVSSPSLQLIAIQAPAGGKVPQWKVISGIVHPYARSIQIFVGAGPITDKWWYRQGERAVVDGFSWTCRCKFGDNKSATGWTFDLCAIIPTAPVLESRVRELPADAVKSEIVTVSLDRSLRDE